MGLVAGTRTPPGQELFNIVKQFMPIRVAVSVDGAVSLGSYGAGVLYELVDALGQHNTVQENKILIDVLTGASSGGVSTTVLAQKLLFEATSLAGPYNNALYNAWVQDVDLQALLALHPAENPTHSLLSSNVIEALSSKYLSQRYVAHSPHVPSRHRAAASSLRIGLALSNINGIDYRCILQPHTHVTYTRFDDRLCATVDSTSDTPECWEPLRNAAVACGAFPFVFRLKDIVRHREEYASPNIDFQVPCAPFTYTDSGMCHHKPLGLAKGLADTIDTHANTESRFYLFIAPHLKRSVSHSHFNQSNGTFKATARRLLTAMYGQAGFRDWIKAEKVNDQIHLLNRRATQLRDAFKNRRVDYGSLQGAANVLLSLLFVGGTNDAETVNQGRDRLKGQFQRDYDDLKTSLSSTAADIWIDSVLTLEKAANLGSRDEMVIYGITADANELASAQIEAFVGFFDQAYRDHDYDVGRLKAQEFLTNSSGLLGTEGHLPIIHYKPKPIRPINHDLDGLTLSEIPHNLYDTIKKRLADSTDVLCNELRIAWPLRELIKVAFVEPQLRKLLRNVKQSL
jgi:hypothetical protein